MTRRGCLNKRRGGPRLLESDELHTTSQRLQRYNLSRGTALLAAVLHVATCIERHAMRSDKGAHCRGLVVNTIVESIVDLDEMCVTPRDAQPGWTATLRPVRTR